MSNFDDVNVRDMRYAIESGILFVCVPREVLEEILKIRARLDEPITWGEARALTSPHWYEDLVDWCTSDEGVPPDDQVLEFWEEYQGWWEEWPQLTVDEIFGWLPREVADEYGEVYENMAGSGANIPASCEEEILQALRAAGYVCEPDDRIVEQKLFNYEGYG